jgi:hypothetical protein
MYTTRRAVRREEQMSTQIDKTQWNAMAGAAAGTTTGEHLTQFNIVAYVLLSSVRGVCYGCCCPHACEPQVCCVLMMIPERKQQQQTS